MPRVCVGAGTCSVLLLILLLLAAIPPASADQAAAVLPASPSPSWHLLPAPQPRMTPYDRLFVTPKLVAPARVPPLAAVPPATPAAPQPTPAGAGTPTVVCGLTVVPGDPSVDPGIAARMPDAATRFTMRSLEPPMCR